MSRPRIAHRADFSVRCACGIAYNTDETHIGKQLKCRCGKTITIARPVGEYADAHEAKLNADAARRMDEAARHAKAAARDRARAKRAERRAAIRSWPRTFVFSIGNRIAESAGAMNSRRPLRRWTARAAWAWFALVILAWILLVTTSERFLPATVLAYGPRFALLLPFAVLLPAAAVVVRSALLPLVVALIVVVGPIMGGRISWRTAGRSMPAASPADRLRVMTFNTQGGGAVAMQIRDLITRVRPDIVAMQECGPALWDSLQALPGWHTDRYANLCTASRFPITGVDSMPRRDFERIRQFGFGGTGLVVRYMLDTPHGPTAFVNLHLETARKGLEGLIGNDGLVPDAMGESPPAGDPSSGTSEERFRLNSEIRDRESERASVWSLHGDPSSRVPVVIAGDFNLPAESTIFRRHWGDFSDAFSSAGSGFGWSKREGRLIRIRVDHILGNAAAPRAVGAWLGDDRGSDHLPVIADLAWQTP